MNVRAGFAATIVAFPALWLAGCGGREPDEPASREAAAAAPVTAPVAAPVAAPEPAVPDAAPPDAAPPDTAPEQAPAMAQQSPAPQMPAATAPPPSKAPAPAEAPPAADAALAPMPGTVTRQTELKAQPSVGARTLGTLAQNTPVTVTTRQGGWLQVTSGESRGWVRLLHVSTLPTARASDARAELEAAARVATGRAGSGNVAVTTGIRGLDEKQLREAKPDTQALQRLQSLGAEPAEAQAHAKRRGLEPRQVPYPPPPQSS